MVRAMRSSSWSAAAVKMLIWTLWLCLLPSVVVAQRQAWNLAVEPNFSSRSSASHLTLGRLSMPQQRTKDGLSILSVEDSRETLEEETDEVDSSQWIASTDAGGRIQIQPRLVTTPVTPESNIISNMRQIVSRVMGEKIDVQQASVRTKVRPQKQKTTTMLSDADLLVWAVTQPCVSEDVWNSLTGREFDNPVTAQALAQMGFQMATARSSEWVDWKPADKHTSACIKKSVHQALHQERAVLVYMGKFIREEGHGSHTPLIKSHSVIDMSPRDMAELLMDSSRVKTYNKMSLGRTDVKVMQRGIDSSTPSFTGEAKIVRNVTQPPLLKKCMEFVTFMYARPLQPQEGEGYLVVTRAVHQGKRASLRGGASAAVKQKYLRSEILLGVNLLRSVPGRPDETEVTSVTHVNSPNVPTMLTGKVGIKGAVGFVKDIRALCQ